MEAACGFWQNRQHRRTRHADRRIWPGISVKPTSRDSAHPSPTCPSGPIFPIRRAIARSTWSSWANRAAEGVPYNNWISPGSLLIWKMSQAIPGRPIRTRVFARSGNTLEWQHRDLPNLPRRPDLLIIYCGHNEFTSRLADSRELTYYFDEWLPSGWDMLVDRVEWSSSVCGLIRETAEKCRIAIPPATSGLRKFVDVPFYSSTEYNTLLVDFERRLEAIVSYAERVGALDRPDRAGRQRRRLRAEPLLPAGGDDARAERESFRARIHGRAAAGNRKP